jgi:beta-lactam-binding protein with PASTA domain
LIVADTSPTALEKVAAETPSPAVEAPLRGHGCMVDLILRFFYFLFHTIALLVLGAAMFGLAGWGAYYLVQREIRGAEVAAPNLAGLKLDKAMEALQKPDGADLSLRVSEREFSETVGEGEIISQFPPEGTHVKAGTVIRVKQSKGTTRVSCPDVLGKPYLNAGIELRNANLVEGEKSYIADANIRKDSVVAQDPPPKSLQFRGSPVNFLISLGPETRRILMPTLTDLTIVEATDRLAKLELSSVPTVTEEPRPDMDDGLIFGQDPAPGASVARDAPIRVTVVRNAGRLPSPSPSPGHGPRPSPPPTPAPMPDMPPARP